MKNEIDADIKMEVDSDVPLPGGIRSENISLFFKKSCFKCCSNAVKQEKMEVDSIPNDKTAKSYDRRANQTQVAVKEVFEKEGDIVFIQVFLKNFIYQGIRLNQ